jgi:dienelactone hydrolase
VLPRIRCASTPRLLTGHDTFELPGFSRSAFTADGETRAVFRRGTGPGVVVIHEVPGITPEVARFGTRVADAGFTVVMPSLFGTPGKPVSTGYIMSQIARACVSREFKVLASRQASPITEWLRALARSLHVELGGKGIGAVGMCLTGNFALAMTVDDYLMAPVLSQPSLPGPLGRARRSALHISDEALSNLRRRTSDGLRVLGLRFTSDPACPAERFARLRDELGSAFEGIEIDSSPGNPQGVAQDSHSVLTTHLVDEEGHPTRAALDRVIGFLKERLA